MNTKERFLDEARQHPDLVLPLDRSIVRFPLSNGERVRIERGENLSEIVVYGFYEKVFDGVIGRVDVGEPVGEIRLHALANLLDATQTGANQ